MKTHVISIVCILAVLAVGLVALGQQEDRRARFRQYREMQMGAIAAIQEHAAQLKAGMEDDAKRRESMGNWQDLSEDERAKLREEWTKRREARGKMIVTMEEKLRLLKGRRQLATEHEESLEELRAIRELAAQEKANKTADRVGALIDKHEKAHQAMLEKLGFGQ